MEHEWKNKNEEYLRELQKMLDVIDNVEDENLRDMILRQFFECDNILTEISEELYYLYYMKGKQE